MFKFYQKHLRETIFRVSCSPPEALGDIDNTQMGSRYVVMIQTVFFYLQQKRTGRSAGTSYTAAAEYLLSVKHG